MITGERHHALVGGNVNVIHVLGVVEGDMIVYKWWNKYKAEWRYAVEKECLITVDEEIIERVNNISKLLK